MDTSAERDVTRERSQDREALEWSQYGATTVHEPPDTETVRRLAARSRRMQLYRWVPARDMFKELPQGFRIELLCASSSDGIRRFVPCDGYEQFISECFTGGLAILDRSQSLSPEQRSSYRASFLLFQKIRRSKSHLMRRFHWSRDLFVRPAGRVDQDESTVLPPELGLNADETGSPWSIAALRRAGHTAAEKCGHNDPTAEVAIQYGLYEAARMNPRACPLESLDELIRDSLFDDPPLDELKESVSTDIEARLCDALNQHLSDDADEFDAWFFGPRSGFINQLAKQRRCPSGAVQPDVVKTLLLKLGWQSYRAVSDCFELQMRCFEYSLPEPLFGVEREQFRTTFRAQPWLGNYPLLLLAERLSLLKLAILDIWESGLSDESIGVVQRLLTIYGWMTRLRRRADRRFKKRKRR